MKISPFLLTIATIACLWISVWRIPRSDGMWVVVAGFTSFLTSYAISSLVTGYLAFKNGIHPGRRDEK